MGLRLLAAFSFRIEVMTASGRDSNKRRGEGEELSTRAKTRRTNGQVTRYGMDFECHSA
jgi:hypothetical protein